MSKITGIKIKNSDNTYSEEIPLGVSASNVEWDSSNTLVDVIQDLQEQAGGQQTITGAASTIVSDNLTASRAVVSNASGKVAASDITSTELGYLDGVTSNIQTQLDGKQATVTGAASTVVSNNLTKNMVLRSSGTGKIIISSTPSSKLDYLNNVRQSIQGQLDDINGFIDSQSYYINGAYYDEQHSAGGWAIDLPSGQWKTIGILQFQVGTNLYMIDMKFPANGGTGTRSLKLTFDGTTELNPWAIVSEPGSANADTAVKMIVPFWVTADQQAEYSEQGKYFIYVKAYQDSGQTMYNLGDDINTHYIYFRHIVDSGEL